jgi:dTDP-4-dehydrorhamnose 3,5-epimerase-like enzyme
MDGERSRVLQLPTYSDDRGYLTVAEWPGIPFPPVRAFWITQPEGIRGQHMHRRCEQVIVAVHGKFRVVTDDGADIWLISPQFGIYVPPLVVVTLSDWSSGAAALVLCSERYEAEDIVPMKGQPCA